MRLSDYIARSKLTAAEFGRAIGVPNKQTMHRYVRGKRFPPPRVLLAIRVATGGDVTADDFVDQHTGAGGCRASRST